MCSHFFPIAGFCPALKAGLDPTTVAGEQIFSAANECKKIISLSKFFASGGEIREWKTGLRIVILAA
jgi:hypothetical protein